MKAEDRAKERYWLEPSNIETQEKYAAYVEGYHQAEKDLEPTLEDVGIILNAFLDFGIENKEQGKTKRLTDKEWCQEVLKRYKETKK